MREPEGVHGQLESFNRNLRLKAAVANNNHLTPKFSSGQVYYTSLILLFCQNLGQIGPVVQEKTQKNEFFVTVKAKFFRKHGMKLNLAPGSYTTSLFCVVAVCRTSCGGTAVVGTKTRSFSHWE